MGAEDVDRRLSRRASWATILAVPIGIVALVLAYLALGGAGSTRSDTTSRSPQLESIDLIARNGPAPHRPALELLVHNGGTGRSLISRAQIEVLDVRPLPLCYTQGDLPTSERYGARLPIDASAGDVVEAPLHQQIGADQDDRFRIDLGVIGRGASEAEELPGLYLFEVGISLIHDGDDEPLSVGTALVSLPALPIATLYFLVSGEFEEVNDIYNGADYYSPHTLWNRVMPCWRANGKVLAASDQGNAARSPQLAEISRTATVPSFSELGD